METLEQSAPLMLELDGPGVGLATVDADAALRLASSYIRLLAKVAEEQLGDTLRFESLQINEGCLEVVTRAVPASIAPEADAIIAGYEAGGTVPRGLRGHWGTYRDAVEDLPTGYLAKRFLAGEERQLLARDLEGAEPTWGSLAVRARLLRVGGKSPTARFESGSEADPFSLELSHDQAKRISLHLYEELDIQATVQRDPAQRIIAGDLEEFLVVPEDADPADAWRRWYRDNDCFWEPRGSR